MYQWIKQNPWITAVAALVTIDVAIIYYDITIYVDLLRLLH